MAASWTLRDTPAPTSVVYLMNAKTQAVRTYIADDAGNYRFSGLDPNVDYQIHAEHNDSASSTHTISSFDTRKDISLTLKLSAKEDRALACSLVNFCLQLT